MQIIFWLIFILWLVSSAVLVLVVLIQSGKGGGLSGLVGAGTSLGDSLGATGAEKTLNRWTTYCAIGFLVLNIALVFMAPKALRNSAYYNSISKSRAEAPAETKRAKGPQTPGEKSGAAAPASAVATTDVATSGSVEAK